MKKIITLLAHLMILVSILSCTTDIPSEPERNNPLDANNPDTQGDPYHLQGEIADGGIQLSWDLFERSGLIGFSIHRMEDNGEFNLLEQVEATTNQYTDQTIQNGHRYDYYIVARTDAGDFQPSEYFKTTINSDPILIIEGESVTHTPTRNVTLSIIAFGAEQILLSNSSNFVGSTWETASSTRQWQLETGEGSKNVYLRVKFAADDTSSVVFDQIETSPLNPMVTINDDSTYTPTRTVRLSLSATGAIEMQLSNDSLQGNESWQEFASDVIWVLTSGKGIKTVYLKVRNDFLIESEGFDSIEPASLNPVLNILPDSTYINRIDIILSMPGVNASEMMISDSSDSSLANWQPYEEFLNWNVTLEDGWKRVYAWFRNDFVIHAEPVVDSVGLDTYAEIASFEWHGSGGDTLGLGDRLTFSLEAVNDVFGADTGGCVEVTVDGWDLIGLSEQGYGRYGQTIIITNDYSNVYDALVSTQFVDRLGNRSARVEANETLNVKTRYIAGDERTFALGESGTDIVMVWIPPGTFEMGSPIEETGRWSNEGPVHTVTFHQGYWLGKYEVTQLQWEAVMGNNPANGRGEGDYYPVYSVSWDNIQVFESELENFFRLPSESEWEYACRAGTNTRFYWGNDLENQEIDNYAWSIDNSNNTHEVGAKWSNNWGLFDMSGNVSEWCEDYFHNDYNEAPIDGSPWLSPVNSMRILRGGSHLSEVIGCRSAHRSAYRPYDRSSGTGLRLVRDAE